MLQVFYILYSILHIDLGCTGDHTWPEQGQPRQQGLVEGGESTGGLG